jgi:hypothetical protein
MHEAFNHPYPISTCIKAEEPEPHPPPPNPKQQTIIIKSSTMAPPFAHFIPYNDKAILDFLASPPAPLCYAEAARAVVLQMHRPDIVERALDQGLLPHDVTSAEAGQTIAHFAANEGAVPLLRSVILKQCVVGCFHCRLGLGWVNDATHTHTFKKPCAPQDPPPPPNSVRL